MRQPDIYIQDQLYAGVCSVLSMHGGGHWVPVDAELNVFDMDVRGRSSSIDFTFIGYALYFGSRVCHQS
jgi:hypothetical protein